MDWNKILEAIDFEVNNVRVDYLIKNSIIRGDVFSILENHCSVIYYPIDNEKNCGFHIKRLINDRLEDLVYINTAKPMGEQVFAAAHELGHIWDVGHKVWKRLSCEDELQQELEEDITNRFAAELLMPKDIFIDTFKYYRHEFGNAGSKIDEETLIKVIAKEMNEFMVPYVAIRKRIHEVGIISDDVNDVLKTHDMSYAEKASVYCGDQNSFVGERTDKKTITQLRQLVDEASEKGTLDEYTLKKIKSDFMMSDPDINKNSYYEMIGEFSDV